MVSKSYTKYIIVLITIISLVLTFSTPGLTQIFPGWGNQEPPGGTGNTWPPNPHGNGTFIRQDPMPENLKDITIFSSNKNGIKLKVEFPDAFDYELAQSPEGKKYRRYKASSEFNVIGNIGEPEILNRVFSLQIPKDAVNIQIKSVKQYFKDIKNENIDLYPIPEIVFEEDPAGLTGSKEVFTINEDLYQKDQIFPETEAQIVEEAFKHDMHLIRLAIPVMIYNPKSAITQEIKAVDLTVTYDTQIKRNAIIIDTQKDPFHKVFNATVPNYTYEKAQEKINKNKGEVREIRGNDLVNPGYNYHPDYLVIAAKLFDFDENEEAHEQLMNWANHRSGEQGGDHKIAIAYVDEIHLAYSQPIIEESIKEFTKMVYEKWRTLENSPDLKFLLLVGDADQGGEGLSWFLPTWGSYTDYAGDNDYAWLIGDDTLNDIMIGRLPAKNKEELKTMVDKIIGFETNPPQGENHYGTRTLMLYGDLYTKEVVPDEVRTNTRELLLSEKQELDEFHTNYLEDLPDFKYDSATVTGILNDDNKGALFVGYHAHGSPGGWGPNVNVFNLTNIEQLPVVVLAQTCSSAQFDLEDSDCYGEQWIKHKEGGSVCYWGSTRLATRNPQVHTDFYFAVFKSQMTILGSGIDLVRERFSMSSADLQRKIFNLLGDPAINFSTYIGESTKPDLSQIETIASPEYPSSYNQNMTVSSSFKNNSDHALNNILVKLYSIESNEKYDVANWTCSLPAQGYEDIDSSWSYLAESSRHFMTWPDPNDTLDELSEFNNWLNSDIQYYPIYVDTNNNTGIEYGTKQEPFKKISSGVAHAFENDLIGDDDCRPDPWKAVEIHLNDGVYGDGSVIDVGSIILKSEHGAEKTIVRDSLQITGSSYHVEGITFRGNGQDSAIQIRQTKNTSQNHDMHLLLRNIFKGWDGYAIDIDQQEFPHPFPQTCHTLQNNIFHNNFGTIYANAKQNVQLFITNNTFTHNENNFFLVSPFPLEGGTIPREINLSVKNNIMWNSGETGGAGAFPERIVFFYKDYNDIDDGTFWDVFGLNSTNINADPKFKNPNQLDFHLNSTSPCINAGDHDSSFRDPDGSYNDMGAYGGPEAIIRPIRILNPFQGQTLYAPGTNPPFQFDLNIHWNAYLLGPQDLVDIEIYHLEYEIAAPDKGGNTYYYNHKKVVDLDVLLENSGTYTTNIEQAIPTQTYWLKITNHENPEEFEKINFKISSETQSIHNNR